MTNKVNSWSEFQPLKQLVIGTTYPPEFFEDVKNSKARDCLQQIASETLEDLDNLKKVVEDFGAKTYTATTEELGYKTSIMDYLDEEGKLGMGSDKHGQHEKGRNQLPVPPLNPRDDFVTMGNQVVMTGSAFESKPWVPLLENWFGDQLDWSIVKNKKKFTRTTANHRNRLGRLGIKDSDIDTLLELEQEQHTTDRMTGFCAPELTRVGKTCFADTQQAVDIADYMEMAYPQFNYKGVFIGGHNDAVFNVLKPGVLLTTQDIGHYSESFPSWDKIFLPESNLNQVRPFLDIKRHNEGKWWMPGEEDNKEFTDFVETWLDDWVGFVEETVFDVNLLMLDEKTAVVNAENLELEKTFNSHGIDMIHVPNRHRHFWDAGWHCVTLDIEREGGQEDYGV